MDFEPTSVQEIWPQSTRNNFIATKLITEYLLSKETGRVARLSNYTLITAMLPPLPTIFYVI
jgi:hypothetical protein